MPQFQGKVALVTGGSLGIGYAAAKKLAQDGASVVICGSRQSVVEESARSLKNEGLEVTGLKADVRSSQEVEQLVQSTVRKYGGLDILVNSAGVQRYGDVLETSEEIWDEVIDINLKGMFLSSKYAIKEMRNRGGGAVVNVSSVQAFASQKGVVAYTASKGGINAMTRAMALDHAHENIRVNVICPASVDTPMLRGAAELFKEDATQEKVVSDWGKMHPVGRVGTPEEVADLIAFLASEKAAFVTGAEVKIDGGMLAALGVSLPE